MTSINPTRKMIKEFNFPDPKWDKLPDGFQKLTKEVLSTEETHLIGAITLAWYATTPKGKNALYKMTTKLGTIFFIAIVSLFGIINLVSSTSGREFTKTVNAATMQLDGVIQSTMSAILKK